MTRAPILPRLLWRPATLYNLFVAVAMAAVLGRGAWIARSAWNDDAPGPATALILACTIAATGVGAIAAWSSFEMALCTCTAALPGLARRLRAELWVLGAACALAAAAAAEIAAALHADPAACAGLAALGFGLGVYVSEPRAARGSPRGWLCFGLVAALVLFSPTLGARIAELPLAATPLAVAAAAVLVALPFTRARQRARVVTPTQEIGMAYAQPDLRSGVWGAQLTAPDSGVPRWKQRLASDRDWMRATLHEVHGYRRGGWIGTAVGAGFFWALVIVAWFAYLGWEDHGDLAGVALNLRGALLESNPGRLSVGTAFFLAIWLGMGLILTPCTPVTTLLRPVSRSRRARLAWRASLAWTVVALGTVAACLALAAEWVRWRDPAAPEAAGLPEWLRAVVVLAILWPIAQWARIRFIDASPVPPGPVRQGVVGGITVIALAAAATFVAQVWAKASGTPVALQLAAAALLFANAQWIWRTVLDQHFRRVDLRA